jgi:hypothetical protein
VAVRDDLGALREADKLADLLGRQRAAGLGEEQNVLEAPCARDVAAPG